MRFDSERCANRWRTYSDDKAPSLIDVILITDRQSCTCDAEGRARIATMKHKIFALILALTVTSWAQTATQTPTQPPPERAKCACCDKMASADVKGVDAKDKGMSCKRMGKDAKGMASCCGAKDGASCCGKDGKGCMNGAKNASCCKEGCKGAKDKTATSCCGGDCKEGCCSKMKMEHAATGCCHHEKQG